MRKTLTAIVIVLAAGALAACKMPWEKAETPPAAPAATGPGAATPADPTAPVDTAATAKPPEPITPPATTPAAAAQK